MLDKHTSDQSSNSDSCSDGVITATDAWVPYADNKVLVTTIFSATIKLDNKRSKGNTDKH